MEDTELQFPIESIFTMTVVAAIESCLDISTLFWTCPLDYISGLRDDPKKIAYLGVPNLVLGAKYGLFARGNININKQGFNHSITFLVTTAIKNVTLRLSVTSIHVSGAKSLENAKEAIFVLVDRLQFCYAIQDEICKMSNDQKQEIYNSLAFLAKGNTVIDKQICYVSTTHCKWPFDKHQKVGQCLLSYVYDYPNYHCYLQFMMFVLQLPQPIITHLLVLEVQSAMFNSKYPLGFNYNKKLMLEHIAQNYEFSIVACVDSIILHLPYERKSSITIRDKKKIPHHTFTITEQGSVTQSSPNIELAVIAYNYFFRVMNSIKSYIQVTEILDLDI